MTTHTGSGTLLLAPFSLSGVGSILSAADGPITRHAEISMNIDFSGKYFDELELALNDAHPWKADGFKYQIRDGVSTGQINRYWHVKNLNIEYEQFVDLDLYSFLSIDGGKGFGQDQLGLPLTMDEIAFIYIKNKRYGSTLKIGGGDVAPWETLFQGAFDLPHGARMIAQSRHLPAWSVTQGSSQFLRLEALGSACTVEVRVAGRYLG